MTKNFRQLVESVILNEALHLMNTAGLEKQGWEHQGKGDNGHVFTHPNHPNIKLQINKTHVQVENTSNGEMNHIQHDGTNRSQISREHLEHTINSVTDHNESGMKGASTKHNGHLSIIGGRPTHIGNDHVKIFNEHGHDTHVLHALAHNPTTPHHILEKIAGSQHAAGDTLAAVANHPNVKTGTINSMATHHNLSASGAHALLNHSGFTQHAALASHPRVSKDRSVMDRVVHNPSTSSKTLDSIGAAHPHLMKSIIGHPNYNARSGQALHNATAAGKDSLIHHNFRLKQLNTE